MLHLPLIAVVNHSTVVTEDEVKAATAALQTQVSRDFAPSGWQDAIVSYFAKAEHVGDDWWQLIIADDSDQANALGYHETTPSGLPNGFAFARTDLTYGLKWTVTASHELLEMLGDPWISQAALHQTSDTQGVVYAYEVCDACEDDSWAYDIDGVLVSDFVMPAYFLSSPPPGAKFDFKDHLTAPFQIGSPGGYMSIFIPGQGWAQSQPPAEHAIGRFAALRAKGDFSRAVRRFKQKG